MKTIMIITQNLAKALEEAETEECSSLRKILTLLGSDEKLILQIKVKQ